MYMYLCYRRGVMDYVHMIRLWGYICDIWRLMEVEGSKGGDVSVDFVRGMGTVHGKAGVHVPVL